jgi:hypothetical protein
VMNRVLLGFCVGVNRVLLERVECGEVCVLWSRERVCGGRVLGCGRWGREGNKNYFSFGSIGYLG